MTVRGGRHGNVASFFFGLFRSLAASCNQQQTGESGKHLTHLSSSCFSWRLIALVDRPPHRRLFFLVWTCLNVFFSGLSWIDVEYFFIESTYELRSFVN